MAGVRYHGKYAGLDSGGKIIPVRRECIYKRLVFSSSIRRIAPSPAGSYKPDPLFALYPYVLYFL
jgi:hypothetical protein